MQPLERRSSGLYATVETPHGLERKLWTSHDIGFTETFQITAADLYGEPAKMKMRVRMDKNSFPPGMTLASLQSLKATPRSRYGQVFVEVEHVAQDLEEYIRELGKTSFDDIDFSSFEPEITVVNYAKRPNVLRKDGGVFRMYYAPIENQLTGDALLSSAVRIDKKPISPEMVKRNRDGEAVALRLTLDPTTRKWIPPGIDPIDINPFDDKQRAQIKDMLKPVPLTEAGIPYLVYSQEELSLPDGIFGLVGSYGYADTNGKATLRSLSTHGTSQLFDPGRTWNMVFELRGQTIPETVANFIDVFLYKAT